MSRYIDYDAINYRHDKIYDKSDEFLNGVVYMAQRIEEAPSIDICFCRECKYSEKATSPITALWCKRFGLKDMAVEADDFCSYGEREGE